MLITQDNAAQVVAEIAAKARLADLQAICASPKLAEFAKINPDEWATAHEFIFSQWVFAASIEGVISIAESTPSRHQVSLMYKEYRYLTIGEIAYFFHQLPLGRWRNETQHVVVRGYNFTFVMDWLGKYLDERDIMKREFKGIEHPYTVDVKLIDTSKATMGQRIKIVNRTYIRGKDTEIAEQIYKLCIGQLPIGHDEYTNRAAALKVVSDLNGLNKGFYFLSTQIDRMHLSTLAKLLEFDALKAQFPQGHKPDATEIAHKLYKIREYVYKYMYRRFNNKLPECGLTGTEALVIFIWHVYKLCGQERIV